VANDLVYCVLFFFGCLRRRPWRLAFGFLAMRKRPYKRRQIPLPLVSWQEAAELRGQSGREQENPYYRKSMREAWEKGKSKRRVADRAGAACRP
jgi:hypothetical protein